MLNESRQYRTRHVTCDCNLFYKNRYACRKVYVMPKTHMHESIPLRSESCHTHESCHKHESRHTHKRVKSRNPVRNESCHTQDVHVRVVKNTLGHAAC